MSIDEECEYYIDDNGERYSKSPQEVKRAKELQMRRYFMNEQELAEIQRGSDWFMQWWSDNVNRSNEAIDTTKTTGIHETWYDKQLKLPGVKDLLELQENCAPPRVERSRKKIEDLEDRMQTLEKAVQYLLSKQIVNGSYYFVKEKTLLSEFKDDN